MSRKFLRQKQKKQKAVAEHPLFVSGVQNHQQGNLQQAEQCYKKVLQELPKHADSLFNLAVIFQNTKRINESVGAYQKLIELHPNYANAYINLGLLLEKFGRLNDALQVYHKATQVKPHYVSYYNLAGPLYQLKKFKDAEIALRESIKLNPNYAQSHMNLATILRETKRFAEAEMEYKEALRLAPEIADAHFNMGKIYEAQNKFEGAIAEYKKALEIDPKHEKAQACLFYRYQRLCMWDEMANLEPQLDALTDELIAAKRCPGITNFSQVARCNDLERNLEIAKAWSRDAERKVAREKPEFSFEVRKKEKDRLVIGYISADFREHAFGHITQYFFGTHDKERFEVRGYATSPDDGSNCRKVIEEGCDEFLDISKLSDAEAAEKIYADAVDILVDMTCYTAGARVEIAALRPAPIQVNMWGFVGTTGADFFDYIIVDDVVVPKEHQQFYSEKLVAIEDTLQVNHRNEEISGKEFTRKEFGLPEGAIIFCSFNQPYKIEPVMFGLWMELLKELQGSVLWLLVAEEEVQKTLLKEAEKRGIESNRIIFAEKIEQRADYFKRIQIADICLDTRIYNGGSTTMDALWAGVPVITLLGNHYASRMSAGLINAVGMPELITNSLEEYKKLAIKLANSPEELASVKDKLWQQREICPLFDTSLITRRIEEAYEKMWKDYKI
jgi:protein O-GlcNAc transferase